jgi:hypothetical protein
MPKMSSTSRPALHGALGRGRDTCRRLPAFLTAPAAVRHLRWPEAPVSERSKLTARHVTEVHDRSPSIAVVQIMQDDVRAAAWAGEPGEVLLRAGHRFDPADLRQRCGTTCANCSALSAARTAEQLAELPATTSGPGLQHLLNRARRSPDGPIGHLQKYGTEQLPVTQILT